MMTAMIVVIMKTIVIITTIAVVIMTIIVTMTKIIVVVMTIVVVITMTTRGRKKASTCHSERGGFPPSPRKLSGRRAWTALGMPSPGL
ncbi:unnamed protein product [Lampetra fluviatilis]